MMEQVLGTLIEGARLARDRHAVARRNAALAVEQAHHTLQRLGQYRGECLARSPAAAGGTPDGDALVDYQRFVGRLDQAIALQGRDVQARQSGLEAAQLTLQESQRRLKALETLVARRAAARALQAQRKDQRDADEFAARAARRTSQEHAP